MENNTLTGYPSIDKPWLKYYTEEAINAPLPECTIYEYLYENNKDHLNDIALNYFDRKISYGELFENIEKTAKAFTAMGVKEGDIVTVCSVTTPEIIYAFYGLNRIGAISNMVDPRTSTEGIKHYIEEVQSKLVVSIDVALPKIEKSVIGTKVEKIITVSPLNSVPYPKKAIATFASRLKGGKVKLSANCIDWNDFYNTTAEPIYAEYKKDTCCVIVHTGGTTGTPKGVMLSNDNLNCAAAQCCDCGIPLGNTQVWLAIMPPFIAYGIGNGLHFPLTTKGQVIIIPKFEPSNFDKLLKKYKPTQCVSAPCHYQPLLESKRIKGEDMSYVVDKVVGGDSIKPELEKQINMFLEEHNCPCRIQKGYGMSEVCAAVSRTTLNENNKIGSAGIPLPQTIISIFDLETGEELPYNKYGEVCSTGPNTMLMYYNNENETNLVIKKHKDGLKWVHSGDLGYMDEDGCLFIEGRIKRMIVRHDGFKVFPTQIESVVLKEQNVEDCCAVGIPDTKHSQGMLPVVFAVISNETDKSTIKAELAKLCKFELPEYAQPVDFIFIDKLPLTPIGKVDFRKLEQVASANN